MPFNAADIQVVIRSVRMLQINNRRHNVSQLFAKASWLSNVRPLAVSLSS
jgi:hypothetical protein